MVRIHELIGWKGTYIFVGRLLLLMVVTINIVYSGFHLLLNRHPLLPEVVSIPIEDTLLSSNELVQIILLQAFLLRLVRSFLFVVFEEAAANVFHGLVQFAEVEFGADAVFGR